VTTQGTDRIFLGAAVAAALVSAGWLVVAEWRLAKPLRVPTVRTESEWTPDAWQDPEVDDASFDRWEPPRAQSRGTDWTYDLFTPPEIHFDPRTRQFAVAAPGDPTGSHKQEPGLQLVAVRREPYQLQLVGYVGSEGHYLGAIQDLRTSEVMLAGAGKQLAGKGATIEGISVRATDGTPDGAFRPRTATAIVRDVRTNALTELTLGELCCTDELRAVLATREDDEETVGEYRTGEELESAERTYTIARLQIEPPAAELTSGSTSSTQRVRLNLTAETAVGRSTTGSAN
jgi:hypothetical protein